MTEDKGAGAGASSDGGRGKEPRRYFRRDSRKPAATPRVVVKQPKFEGKNEDLKGHIFDCANVKQSDVFTKTTKEIGDYVGSNFKYGSNVRLAIESLSIPTLDEPADPPKDAGLGEMRRWEKRLDESVKRENMSLTHI